MLSKKPLILCVHGGGTSGAIFSAQLRNLRSRLKNHYEFIFINAPREGPAGPGVLPLFADSGPYYWWFGAGWRQSTTPGSRPGSDDELHGAAIMESAVIQNLSSQGYSPKDVVGLLGFSEGALAATLLLWRLSLTSRPEFIGRPSPWKSLRFSVLLCPGYRSDVAQMCYQDDGNAQVMEFNGAHHVPTAPADLDKLTIAIYETARRGEKWARAAEARAGRLVRLQTPVSNFYEKGGQVLVQEVEIVDINA